MGFQKVIQTAIRKFSRTRRPAQLNSLGSVAIFELCWQPSTWKFLYFISHQSCCIHFHLVIYKALDVYYTYTKTDNIACSEQRKDVALHQLGQIIEDKDTFKTQLWFESNEKGLLKDEIAILTSENDMLREKLELLEKVKESFLSNHHSPYQIYCSTCYWVHNYK